MKLYVACSYRVRGHASRMAALLAAHGHTIVSHWHEENGRDTDPQDEAGRAALQATNEADIATADALVVLSHVGEPRATYWEAGWGAALGLPAVWLHGADGRGRCLGDSRPDVHRLVAHGRDDVDAAAIVDALARLERARAGAPRSALLDAVERASTWDETVQALRAVDAATRARLSGGRS